MGLTGSPQEVIKVPAVEHCVIKALAVKLCVIKTPVVKHCVTKSQAVKLYTILYVLPHTYQKCYFKAHMLSHPSSSKLTIALQHFNCHCGSICLAGDIS